MATTLANPQTQGNDTGNAPVVEQPQQPDPPSFGKNNRHLPQILKDTLAGLIKDFQQRDQYDRRIEVLTDRIMRFYDDGVQHVYPNYGTGVYQVGTAGATIDLGDGNQNQCSDYLGAYNIFRARRRTIDAVLTQNPPGIVFEPDKPDRSEDIEAAETAEGYRHLFDQKNDVPDIQQTVTRFFELSGRVVAWTYTTTNREKFGLNDDGEPRQMETVKVYGTLESKVPIICRDQDQALYCFLYEDPDVLVARNDNPWLRNEDGSWKITAGEAGIGESDWERFARLGVRQSRKGYYLTGTALAHIVTEMHGFIRPAAFTHQSCEEPYTGPSGWDEEANDYIREPSVNDDGEPMTIGDMCRQLWPEGVHATYIGKTYSEAVPASMDDCIDIVMSEKRDSLTGGALMEPMKVVQDGYNDFKNAEREYYEKGWPVTWFKGDQQDYDSFIGQQSKPAQFALLKNPIGGPEIPVENQFFREPEMQAPESFVQCMEEYRTALSQDVTGASPALEGVAGSKEETASQRAMDRAQSMGILGPCWSRVQKVFAGIYKKAALWAAKNPDHAKEIVVATGNKQTTTIRLERLTRGSFHCKPDADSTFPESTQAKRATLATMLPQIAASPVGQEFFQSPDNWEEVLALQGFPELTLTPALAYRKQTRELEILLREAPVPNQQAVDAYNIQHAQQALIAVTQGLPEPPYAPPPPELPSLQPKKYDYHMWEFKKCQEFLSSEDCWRQEVEGNADGVRNVELHADMHQQMMAALAPPPMPTAAPPMPAAKPNGHAPEAKPKVQNASQPPGAPGQPTL
jgi:hypothetical protein